MGDDAMEAVNEIERDILARIGLAGFWQTEVEPEIRAQIKERWAEIIREKVQK